MSETDTVERLLWYVEQVMGPISTEVCENPGDDDLSILAHNFAAYLREHFVTREEYEASVNGERLQMAGKHKEAEEARLWFTKAQEWRSELATLTAERDRLRAALEVIRDNEWVENCLDPQWAAMIAHKTLNPRTCDG